MLSYCKCTLKCIQKKVSAMLIVPFLQCFSGLTVRNVTLDLKKIVTISLDFHNLVETEISCTSHLAISIQPKMKCACMSRYFRARTLIFYYCSTETHACSGGARQWRPGYFMAGGAHTRTAPPPPPPPPPPPGLVPRPKRT